MRNLAALRVERQTRTNVNWIELYRDVVAANDVKGTSLA
jgi:hypothetical protein